VPWARSELSLIDSLDEDFIEADGRDEQSANRRAAGRGPGVSGADLAGVFR
jgi:hypothetical protein